MHRASSLSQLRDHRLRHIKAIDGPSIAFGRCTHGRVPGSKLIIAQNASLVVPGARYVGYRPRSPAATAARGSSARHATSIPAVID